MFDLSGKTALVTGANTGLGQAMALALAEAGADIALIGRTAPVETLNQIEKIGVKAHSILTDLSHADRVADVIAEAVSALGRVDILVNNAGILKDGLIGMIPEDSIRETLETNVNGSLYMIQSCARLIARNDGGSIINLSSIIGRFGNRGQLAYSASKAGVIGATLSAAKELAPTSIRVNAIAPGYIDTDMIKDIDPEIDKERRDSIAMGRIGTPQDVANLALFLASDLSSYVTGQVIGVDGGMLV